VGAVASPKDCCQSTHPPENRTCEFPHIRLRPLRRPREEPGLKSVSHLRPSRYAPAGGMSLFFEARAHAGSSHVCSQSVNSRFHAVLGLSRDERPFGSLLPFGPGSYPYPHDYSTAFAFSEIPYPPACRLLLRFGFRFHGDRRAYHVPHKYLTGDSGSAFRPTAQHPRRRKSQPPNLAAHHFGSGMSAPSACFISRSLSVIHIRQPYHPAPAPDRPGADSRHLPSRFSEDEASFVPAHFIQQAGY